MSRLQLTDAGLQQLQLCLRIGIKGHIQVFGNKLAEVVIGPAITLLGKCRGRILLDQGFTLSLKRRNPLLPAARPKSGTLGKRE